MSLDISYLNRGDFQNYLNCHVRKTKRGSIQTVGGTHKLLRQISFSNLIIVFTLVKNKNPRMVKCRVTGGIRNMNTYFNAFQGVRVANET